MGKSSKIRQNQFIRKIYSDVGFALSPGTIFDGVDERQIAAALELAYFDAQAEGFQYICALNSETLPYDFSETFKTEFDKHVVIIFTDASDDGGLLGIRF